MNLQPSNAGLADISRRQLFASELQFGGHGQVPLSAGTFTPTNSSYVFYEIDFLTASVVTSAVFNSRASDGTTIYAVNSASYNGLSFPAGYKWFAPITSLTLASGTALGYEYQINTNIQCQGPLW